MTHQAVWIQEFEMDFLANIFDRVDRTRRGRVATVDLMVAVLLLGSVPTAYEKAGFLFHIFDSDHDGCLTREQILRLYGSIPIHGAIARADTASYDADIMFGDELSLAKARRLFEFTLLH